MPERRAHDFILDITISKEEYLCRITNTVTDKTHICRAKIRKTSETTEINEISLVNLARSIHYILSYSADADLGIGMDFLREKIRACIQAGAREDCFCLDHSGPAIGVFITWKDEEHEA